MDQQNYSQSMKWAAYFMFFCLTACGKKIPSTVKTDTFHVSGNCGMCKKIIEKSLHVEGVFKSDWNKKTKMITVVYDITLITLVDIQRKIAKVGYNNDGFKAELSDYENLYSCCKYDRNKQDSY